MNDVAFMLLPSALCLALSLRPDAFRQFIDDPSPGKISRGQAATKIWIPMYHPQATRAKRLSVGMCHDILLSKVLCYIDVKLATNIWSSHSMWDMELYGNRLNPKRAGARHLQQ